MAKTDQPVICQQYVMEKLVEIQRQLDECNVELVRQIQSSSISNFLPSIEIIDNYLKEYVSLQEKYLFKRIENQLSIFQNDIHDQKLYHQLSDYKLTTIQQQTIQQLIHLQQQHLNCYEELIMFKERILNQLLSPIFYQIEQYITTQDFYRPLIDDQTCIEMKMKHRKMLQQRKRTILHMHMYAYQYKINDYEEQYEQLLSEIELNFSCNTIIINGLTLVQAIKNYMNHRITRNKQEIYDKISHFRHIIAHRRQRSSIARKTIDVSPQITIGVLHHTLNVNELAYLSKGMIIYCY